MAAMVDRFNSENMAKKIVWQKKQPISAIHVDVERGINWKQGHRMNATVFM